MQPVLTNMPRLTLLSARVAFNTSKLTSRPTFRPLSTTTSTKLAGPSRNESTPGWTGRHGEDKIQERPADDVQAETSQQGMKDHENLKEGSQPISRKDEGDNNKRAQEEFPEAPGPVIGMNDEKGPKGH